MSSTTCGKGDTDGKRSDAAPLVGIVRYELLPVRKTVDSGLSTINNWQHHEKVR